jgi:hypothetical protein
MLRRVVIRIHLADADNSSDSVLASVPESAATDRSRTPAARPTPRESVERLEVL